MAAPGDVVCLEVFDDVGVERPDGTKIAEQNKSNLTHNPLSDRAVDLWKTLRIWVDAVVSGELDETAAYLYFTPQIRPTVLSLSHSTMRRCSMKPLKPISPGKELLGNADGDKNHSVSEQLSPHLKKFTVPDRLSRRLYAALPSNRVRAARTKTLRRSLCRSW